MAYENNPTMEEYMCQISGGTNDQPALARPEPNKRKIDARSLSPAEVQAESDQEDTMPARKKVRVKASDNKPRKASSKRLWQYRGTGDTRSGLGFPSEDSFNDEDDFEQVSRKLSDQEHEETEYRMDALFDVAKEIWTK